MRATPVVNSLLRVGFREKASDLTPLKVQKLLYFLHGWYLAVTGEVLVDEGFLKWQYGPVCRSIYDSLKTYGGSPVDDYIREMDPEHRDVTAFFVNTKVKDRFEEVLDAVWKKYSGYTAAQLSTLTHLHNTPWSLTEDRELIDNDLIRQYFVDAAAKNQARLTQQHEYVLAD